jgi:NAD(P)-dependent dehydrogenase (short-subunit alcohol dehydrogenase family)
MRHSNFTDSAFTEIAVVTGAGSGLGRALSVELSQRGVFVVGFGRRSEPLEETKALAAPGLFTAMSVDVRSDSAVVDAFSQIESLWGDVTILINNAAVYARRDLIEETSESFMDSIHVNLGGVVSCSNAALRMMTRRGSGTIINVGSFADVEPEPSSAAYSVSKGAARILTKCYVADLSDRFPDVLISNWMPGILATDMGRADGIDPAAAAKWGANLALRRDRFINGAVFERDREILPARSLKQRLRDRIFLRPKMQPRFLTATATEH